MRDVGLHPYNVLRPRKACQSCIIIASINLICACEDKVWPLRYVIVWLTYLIHDPTALATGKKLLPNSLSFLKYTTQHFSSPSFLAIVPTILSQVWCQNSDLCFMRDDLFCEVVDMVSVVWNEMINNKRKVMDRGLLIYDYTPWQEIYSIPMKTEVWLVSFTETTAIEAPSVICFNNITVFVAFFVRIWQTDFINSPLSAGAKVTVIHNSDLFFLHEE